MKSPRTAVPLIAFATFVLAGLAGCQSSTPPAATPAANESAERYKAVYRRLIDVAFNQGDTTIVDSLVVENPIDHMQVPPGMPTGRAGLKQMIMMYRAAFPDLNIKVEDIMVEDDRLIAYTVMTGTHSGELMGMKPTGKPVRVEGFDRVRFEGDRMAEHWGTSDDAGMMRQLGVSAP